MKTIRIFILLFVIFLFLEGKAQVQNTKLDLIVVDGVPPGNAALFTTVGDVWGNGKCEIFMGCSEGGIFWYDAKTHERHTVTANPAHFHVGSILMDIDGDGIKELLACEAPLSTEDWKLTFYKAQKDYRLPWTRYVIDPKCLAGAHDIVFADLDNDGKNEIIANATYGDVWGVFAYKAGKDPLKPWIKYEIQTGHSEEGLAIADLDGDGKLEIISGVDYYKAPTNGTFSGPWTRFNYAPNFREMVRLSQTDINGDGYPDIVLGESEYPDGILSWFENRIKKDPTNPWVEHRLDARLVYGHSNCSWRDEKDGTAHIFAAEMMKGGWDNPYNFKARLIEFTSADSGKTWNRDILNEGTGGHNMIMYDVDNDGEKEIVGHMWGDYMKMPGHMAQIWKRVKTPSPLTQVKHRLLDRDKPDRSTDILSVDIDGDGKEDVVCGHYWYQNDSWKRYEIPGIYQVHYAFDIDHDGKKELIATKASQTTNKDPTMKLSGDLYWIKPSNAVAGKWEEHRIGMGSGGCPASIVIAPILKGNKLAMLVSYRNKAFPEIFEIPKDTKTSWNKRTLAELNYGSDLVIADLNNDGKPDVIAGDILLENKGDGNFRIRRFIDSSLNFKFCKLKMADVNNDGKPDLIATEIALDTVANKADFARIAWFENPGNNTSDWQIHGIDKIRSPQSLDIADLDKDGNVEIISGENEIKWGPYRESGRLIVYKKADPKGLGWYRYVLDDRFEHCNGTKVMHLAPGKLAIISIGWLNSAYVNMWELDASAK